MLNKDYSTIQKIFYCPCLSATIFRSYMHLKIVANHLAEEVQFYQCYVRTDLQRLREVKRSSREGEGKINHCQNGICSHIQTEPISTTTSRFSDDFEQCECSMLLHVITCTGIDGTWRQGFFVHLPLDSPYITMVKVARIANKSLSPSTIFVCLNVNICPNLYENDSPEGSFTVLLQASRSACYGNKRPNYRVQKLSQSCKHSMAE